MIAAVDTVRGMTPAERDERNERAYLANCAAEEVTELAEHLLDILDGLVEANRESPRASVALVVAQRIKELGLALTNLGDPDETVEGIRLQAFPKEQRAKARAQRRSGAGGAA
jgi:hypothetical protein